MAKSLIKSAEKARKILLFVWLGFFLINLTVVFYLFFDHWIEMDNFKAVLKQLNAAYAPYMGVMLLFYWGSARKKQSVKTGMPFTLALICSFLWNVIILIFILALPIEDALENIKDTGALISWLVAGAIGYYFANTASTAEESDSGNKETR